jgi:Ca2+-binding RTX toxin-like protein
MMVNLNQHLAEGMGKDEITSVEGVIGSRFDDTITGNKEANVLDGGEGNDVIRGLGGADTLTGGAGRDTFVWHAKDVVDAKGNHLGVDTVTDFGKDDTLDFRKLLQGQKYDSIEEVVAIKNDGANSHVLARLDGNWVEVAVLNDFHASSPSELLKSGMLLA